MDSLAKDSSLMTQDLNVWAKKIQTRKKMIEVFKALGLTLIFGGVVIALLTITALKKNNGR